MTRILNFSGWSRLNEQAEGIEQKIKAMQPLELRFYKSPDGSSTFDILGKIGKAVFLDFRDDKMAVRTIDVDTLEAKELKSWKEANLEAISSALGLFFSAAGLVQANDQDAIDVAKELATTVLGVKPVDMTSTLKATYASLLNKDGNVLQGNLDYIPAINGAMADVVKNFNDQQG
jgi:hypothetical protein